MGTPFVVGPVFLVDLVLGTWENGRTMKYRFPHYCPNVASQNPYKFLFYSVIGVVSGEIDLHGPDYSVPARLIRFWDRQHNLRLRFLTNNFQLPALTIAQLYKRRWDVELFFKWIKQHLRIKKFYGTSAKGVTGSRLPTSATHPF